jgi:cysteine sulfinate desulfinase/cysteine desulfurase-like protein
VLALVPLVESNVWVIHSCLEQFRLDSRVGAPEVIISCIEHPSIVETARAMAKAGKCGESSADLDQRE